MDFRHLIISWVLSWFGFPWFSMMAFLCPRMQGSVSSHILRVLLAGSPLRPPCCWWPWWLGGGEARDCIECPSAGSLRTSLGLCVSVRKTTQTECRFQHTHQGCLSTTSPLMLTLIPWPRPCVSTSSKVQPSCPTPSLTSLFFFSTEYVTLF